MMTKPGISLSALLKFLAFVICHAITDELIAQTIVDTTLLAKVDSSPFLKTQILYFKAEDPDVAENFDTNSSLLVKEPIVGVQLNNFYPIYANHFDESASGQFYSYGQNAVIKGKSYFRNYTFYSPNKSLSEIELNRGRAILNSQKGFQDNFDLHLLFASRFKGNVLWNFSYDRSIHSGIYSNENQRHTLFRTGIHFNAFKEKLRANIIYLDTRYSHFNNWGIESDSVLYVDQFSVREAVPVRNSSSETEGFTRSIGLNAIYKFSKEKKTYFSKVKWQSILSRYSFAFNESNAIDYPHLYGYFLIDTLLSHHITEDRWENSIGLNFVENHFHTLDLMMSYTSINSALSSVDRYINHFQVEANYSKPLVKGIVHANGKLHFIKEALYPELNISMSSPLSASLNFEAQAFYHHRPLPYIYTDLHINEQALWSGIELEKEYNIKGFKLHLEKMMGTPMSFRGTYQYYNNYIYLDESAYPISVQGISDFRLSFDTELKYKRLGYNFHLKYRYNQIDPYGWNGFSSTHEVRLSSFLFKKVVRSEFGIRFHIQEHKRRMNYNPLLQLFTASDTPGKSFYNLASFFNFHVQDFKFSLNLTNMESMWEKEIPFITDHYPYYDFMLSMGISWKFVN